jgi:hypothetical protein
VPSVVTRIREGNIRIYQPASQVIVLADAPGMHAVNEIGSSKVWVRGWRVKCMHGCGQVWVSGADSVQERVWAVKTNVWQISNGRV